MLERKIGIIYNQTNKLSKLMKTNEFLNYEAPQVEIVEVEVEQGFAVSYPGLDPNELPL